MVVVEIAHRPIGCGLGYQSSGLPVETGTGQMELQEASDLGAIHGDRSRVDRIR